MNCSVTILCLQPELDLLIVSLTLIISLVLTGLSLAILLSHRRSVKPGNTRKRSGCHCQNVAVQINAQKTKQNKKTSNCILSIWVPFRFLVKKIWPTIPTPDSKFQGLFTVYGGNFQVRTSPQPFCDPGCFVLNANISTLQSPSEHADV